VQTFLYLTAHDVPCRIVATLPGEGLVVAHRDFLPTSLRPGPDLYLICLLADRDEPGFIGRHPFAQFHMVQNPTDRRVTQPEALWSAAYVPYWPQPGLVPRDPSRRDRFETAMFFGYPHNLAAEMREAAWAQQLIEMGLRWVIPHRARWHDYESADVVVAVRAFDDERAYEGKPASKLHNAWRAGVPAVLGQESAFQAYQRSPLDYIEVASPEATLEALRQLRDQPALRRDMAENGMARARDVHPAQIAGRWRDILTHRLGPSYERWRGASHSERQRFFDDRLIAEQRAAVIRNVHGPLYPPIDSDATGDVLPDSGAVTWR